MGTAYDAVFTPSARSLTNYYPFGMEQMNRSASTGKSRFGYNGKLKDNDLKGLGNSYDYGARFYDPRAARFLSIDPLMREYPSNSSYLYADNRPIDYIDKNGMLGDKPGTDYAISVSGIKKSKLSAKKKTELINTERKAWITGSTYSTVAFLSVYAGYYAPQAASSAWYLLRRVDPDGSKTAGTIAGFIDPNPGADYPGFGDDIGRFVGETFEFAKNKFFTIVTENISGWSDNAKSYQEFVTGVKAGYAFEVNDVRFDGIRDGVLLEAKSSYDKFVDKTTGKFKDWFLKSKTGAAALIDQARRQVEAADGAKIQWHFKTQETLEATKALFEKDESLKSIELIYTPQKE